MLSSSGRRILPIRLLSVPWPHPVAWLILSPSYLHIHPYDPAGAACGSSDTIQTCYEKARRNPRISRLVCDCILWGMSAHALDMSLRGPTRRSDRTAALRTGPRRGRRSNLNAESARLLRFARNDRMSPPPARFSPTPGRGPRELSAVRWFGSSSFSGWQPQVRRPWGWLL
jgi:hypothetical protein